MSSTGFIADLEQCTTEEEVKMEFIREFGIDGTIRDQYDLATDNILFEFKYDWNMANRHILAKVVAQALYYIRDIKYGQQDIQIPKYISVCDVNEATLMQTTRFKYLYEDRTYDWNRAPSSPDPTLVDHIANAYLSDVYVYWLPTIGELNDFRKHLNRAMGDSEITDKKIINGDNFEQVFIYWKEVIGQHLMGIDDIALYFVMDVQDDTVFEEHKNQVTVDFQTPQGRDRQFVSLSNYKHFWSIYSRPPSRKDMETILTKADRLNKIDERRINGEFFTPLVFVNKGMGYLNEVLGEGWERKYKVWDMCAGTGNLEYYFSSYENTYMSTLVEKDVSYMEVMYPGATVFQYDYLNDDVDRIRRGYDLLDDVVGWKMPRELREDMADENNEWVVLINPPFGTACTGLGKGHKAGNTDSKIKEWMREDEDFGRAIQEIYVQFLYRIKKTISNVHLGLFSPIKHLLATTFKKFRNNFLDFNFENGMIFPSWVFHGNSGKWPVGFMVWDIEDNEPVIDQSIELDVFNDDGFKIGEKEIKVIDPSEGLNKWINRPRCSTGETVPPMSSAINQYSGKNPLDKLPEDAFGYLTATSNDPQHANYTALHTTAYGGGHGCAITQETFKKCMITFTVRRSIKDTWTNDSDQFKQPNRELSDEFVSDCIIYALFHGNNVSSSLHGIEYKDEVYDVRNEFFPFSVDDVRDFNSPMDMFTQLRTADDTYVSKWIEEHDLSDKATELLDAAKEAYRVFFDNLDNINQRKWKIHFWDVGWYQVRMSLKDHGMAEDELEKVKVLHKELKAKLLPQIYDYGFIDEEEMYEEN